MKVNDFATQIWPFREYYGQDMLGTFERLAEIGFAAVELCRWYTWTDLFDKWSAEEIRLASQQAGIQVISSHIYYPMIFESNLDEVVRFCHTVGMKYAIVAAVPADQSGSRQDLLRVADLFNQAAQALKPEGIQVGYHNHGFDFQPLADSGELPWELLFDNTDPEVVMQIDIGNARQGGADPVHYLEKYPGRTRLVHLKEYAAGRAVEAIGDGEVDWGAVIAACERFQLPEWYIVEQEEPDYDPWVSAERSLAYLRKTLKD